MKFRRERRYLVEKLSRDERNMIEYMRELPHEEVWWIRFIVMGLAGRRLADAPPQKRRSIALVEAGARSPVPIPAESTAEEDLGAFRRRQPDLFLAEQPHLRLVWSAPSPGERR
ncbi:MAG: hypothetical protein ABR567_09510 [Myxococcales bacterium]